ncbi:MAG: hypothetical protein ACRDJE_01055 [Dehalococcoidia bacterium]
MRTLATRRARPHGTPRLAAVAGAALLLLSLGACADQQTILFRNHLDHPVTVQIDGDRLLILAPETTEGLPYTAAAWNWPRTITVRDYVSGERLYTFEADTPRLIRNRWRVDIR